MDDQKTLDLTKGDNLSVFEKMACWLFGYHMLRALGATPLRNLLIFFFTVPCVGIPLVLGFFLKAEVKDPGIAGIGTRPASQAGITLRAVVDSATKTVLKEDGVTPVIYPDSVTVEVMPSGITLGDVEAAQD